MSQIKTHRNLEPGDVFVHQGYLRPGEPAQKDEKPPFTSVVFQRVSFEPAEENSKWRAPHMMPDPIVIGYICLPLRPELRSGRAENRMMDMGTFRIADPATIKQAGLNRKRYYRLDLGDIRLVSLSQRHTEEYELHRGKLADSVFETIEARLDEMEQHGQINLSACGHILTQQYIRDLGLKLKVLDIGLDFDS